MTASEVIAALQSLYGANQSGRVGNVTLLASGFEADIFAFSLETGSVSNDLVVRLFDGAGAAEKANKEFAVMTRLREIGYPVPQVKVLCKDSALQGRPFIVMERIRGVPLGQRYWSDHEEWKREARATLSDVMARLHRLDGGQVLPNERSPTLFLEHEFARLEEMSEQLGESGPGSLHAVIRWMRDKARRVTCERLALVHGDFHYNNVLVRDDGALFVIDWSNVRLADPRLDLAWLRLVTTGDRDVLDYERHSGKAVTDLEFFEAIACLKLLLNVMLTLTFGAARQGLRPAIEARMRNGSEHTKYVGARLQEIAGFRMQDLDGALTRLFEGAPPP